jgi:prepilin-type N-terminal cleavage/methylation domain-containing protein
MREPEGRKAGFTLLELLVVIGIIALLASIVVSLFGHVKRSQKRFACASNMRMIYTALRQYQLDERGLPPFSPTLSDQIYAYQTAGMGIPPGPERNWFGLWALVETGDLSSQARLHCPAGRMVWVGNAGNPLTYQPGGMGDAVEDKYFYATYQAFDNIDATRQYWIYQPYRGITSAMDPTLHRRQLWPYPDGSGQIRWMPSDSTVALWCPHHRTGRDAATVVMYWNGAIHIKRDFVTDPNPPFIDPLAR